MSPLSVPIDELRPAPANGPPDGAAPHGDSIGAPAGILRRAGALAIDLMVVVAFMFAWAYVLVMGFGYPVRSGALGRIDLPYFTVTFAFAWLYCAGLEGGPHAATWGKRAMGICVRNLEGEPPGFGRASLRFLARLLTIATAMLGWFLILLTPRRQALHDLVSRTTVRRRAA